MRKSLFVGLVFSLSLAGCVSTEDYQKLDARLSVVEARYYSLDEDNKKIHDYLDKNYETMKKSFANARKSHDALQSKVNEHDQTIKNWQQGAQPQ